MKQVFIIFICVFAFNLSSMSQIKFGIKGGLTTTSIKTDEVLSIRNQLDIDKLMVKGKDSKVGFQAGIFTRIQILAFYIQPELLFSSTGGEVEITSLKSDKKIASEIRKQEFRHIDFPILLGFKVGPLRLQAGPVGTIVLDSKPSLKGFMDMDYKEEFKNASWGYQVGIGFDLFKTLTLDVKYEGNLSKLGESVNIGNESFDFDSRNSQFIVSLGIFF
ncbi:MAG: PorT family protein [Bacteroidales bacterium]|nr:PorT family protein [Bacteroidales bacterium]